MGYLRKTIRQDFIPGSPGSPGHPGQAYAPAYSYTVTETVTRQEPVYGYRPGTGSLEPGAVENPVIVIGYRTVTETVTRVVHVPEQPYIAPSDPVPARPDQRITDYNLGWNAGGSSAGLWTGDLELSFALKTPVVGVVVGLSAPEQNVGQSMQEIGWAFYAHDDRYQIVERGQIKTTSEPYSETDTFALRRLGNTIQYWVTGVLVHTSAEPVGSLALIADCSLFSGGDVIWDAQVAALSLSGGGGRDVDGPDSGRMRPMQAVGYAEAQGVGEGEFAPLTGFGQGGAIEGGNGVLAPLQALGYAGSSYGDGRGVLAPLEAEGSGGFVVPQTYAYGNGVMAPMMGAGHGLSGQTGSGDGVFPALEALGADRADYGAGSGRMKPLEGDGFVFSAIDAFGQARVALKARGSLVDAQCQGRAAWALAGAGLGGALGRAGLPGLASAGRLSAGEVPLRGRARWPALRLLWGRGAVRLALVSRGRFRDEAAAGLAAGELWCTNLARGETTRWLNAGFVDVLRLGDAAFGVAEDGLYRLDGERDGTARIAARIKTHPHDFGTSQHKAVPYLYAGNAGRLLLRATVDGEAMGPYPSGPGAQRIQLGRGASGRYWAFELVNVAGGELRLDGLEPVLALSVRKVRGRR